MRLSRKMCLQQGFANKVALVYSYLNSSSQGVSYTHNKEYADNVAVSCADDDYPYNAYFFPDSATLSTYGSGSAYISVTTCKRLNNIIIGNSLADTYWIMFFNGTVCYVMLHIVGGTSVKNYVTTGLNMSKTHVDWKMSLSLPAAYSYGINRANANIIVNADETTLRSFVPSTFSSYAATINDNPY